ncbi:MAG: MoaD/ThiS family protein [Firmicutes bacterium]|nr:MoaD/ThiS family protein [Bacillota bacterium]
MNIKVKLLTTFKKYGEGKISENGTIPLPKGSTLRDVLKYFDIPLDMPKVLLVNKDDQQNLDHEVNDGDEVVVFSFICGG